MNDFYRRKVRLKREKGLRKRLFTITKCLITALVPVPFAAAIVGIWYVAFYRNQIHVSTDMVTIIAIMLLPVLIVPFAMFLNDTFSYARQKHHRMSVAAWRRDKYTFMECRLQPISPLTHTMMGVPALVLMFLACLVDYPAPRFGVLVVGIMSYMYTFFLVVVTEIDDPCCRLWYIRDAPPDYREDDPRVYVQTRNGHRHRQHRRKDDVEVEFEN